MSRPNINGRALRARLAPLALGSLGAFSLAAPSAATTLVPLEPLTPGGALEPGGALAPGRALEPGGALEPSGAFLTGARARLVFRRLHGELVVLDGHTATVAGALLPARGGRLVELQGHGRHGWRTLARSFTGARGRFRVGFQARGLHPWALRVRFPGDYAASATARRVGVLSVFRLAGASWYGGGGSLACGGWLTSSTLGVANKTLPCGTLVTLRYRRRSITVPVIDRGPYVAGRDFDLTEATKRALGFEGTGNVWSSR